MAVTSKFGFGDVLLLPFPFTDQSGAKKRPAVVVSSSGYNTSRLDLVIMAITSQVRDPLGFGESMLTDGRLPVSSIRPTASPSLPPHRTPLPSPAAARR